MFVHRKFTAATCACALVIGLAACNGGGGGSSGPTAEEQRASVERLVEAAEAAITSVVTASGTGAASPALIDAALEAVAAAAAALANADGLSDTEKSALDTAISVIERRLIEEQRKAMAGAARRLSVVIGGPKITGIRAAVAHGEAPSMSGTVPGNPAVPVAGLRTTMDGAARPVGRWHGGTYSAATAEVADTVFLYTNIETPDARPFSGEDGKYSTANGLDADGNLPIVAGTDPTLVASAAFPSGPGIVSHETRADGTARIAGSFDGAAGEYVCTPETGGTPHLLSSVGRLTRRTLMRRLRALGARGRTGSGFPAWRRRHRATGRRRCGGARAWPCPRARRARYLAWLTGSR